jgi:hypothetical protein
MLMRDGGRGGQAELLKKQGTALAPAERQALEAYMYDTFKLDVQALQLLVGPVLPALREALAAPTTRAVASAGHDTESPSYHLIEETTASLTIAQCIAADVLALPRVRVTGLVPRLRVSVTPDRYRGFMQCLNTVLASFMVARPPATIVAGRDALPAPAPAADASSPLAAPVPAVAPVAALNVPVLLGPAASDADDAVWLAEALVESEASEVDPSAVTDPISRATSAAPSVAMAASVAPAALPAAAGMEAWRQRQAVVAIEIGEVAVVLGSYAALAATRLTLGVVDRRHDARVRLSLQSLAITDLTHRRPGPPATIVRIAAAAAATTTDTQESSVPADAGPGDADDKAHGWAAEDADLPGVEATELALGGAAMALLFTEVRPTSPELMTVHGGRRQTVALHLGRVLVRVDVPVFLPFLAFAIDAFVPEGGTSPLPAVVNAAPVNLLEGLVAQVVPSENTDAARLITMHFTATLHGTGLTVFFDAQQLLAHVGMAGALHRWWAALELSLCGDQGRAMVVAAVRATAVRVVERPYGLAVDGRVGPLDVADIMAAPAAATSDGLAAQPWWQAGTSSSDDQPLVLAGARDIVGSQGAPVGTFRFEQWHRGTPVYPGHDAAVFLRVRALAVTFNEPALLWLVRQGKGRALCSFTAHMAYGA